jgi:hypothetical protein
MILLGLYLEVLLYSLADYFGSVGGFRSIYPLGRTYHTSGFVLLRFSYNF